MYKLKNKLRLFNKDFPSLDIFNEFDNIFDRLDETFKYSNYLDRSGGSILNKWLKKPLINVSETDKEYNIELSVPGFTKDEVKIELDNGILTIAGFKKSSGKDNYSYSEFSSHSFERKLSLPESVIEDGIVAKYEDGILTLTIPKLEKKKTTTREIKID